MVYRQVCCGSFFDEQYTYAEDRSYRHDWLTISSRSCESNRDDRLHSLVDMMEAINDRSEDDQAAEEFEPM